MWCLAWSPRDLRIGGRVCCCLHHCLFSPTFKISTTLHLTRTIFIYFSSLCVCLKMTSLPLPPPIHLISTSVTFFFYLYFAPLVPWKAFLRTLCTTWSSVGRHSFVLHAITNFCKWALAMSFLGLSFPQIFAWTFFFSTSCFILGHLLLGPCSIHSFFDFA